MLTKTDELKFFIKQADVYFFGQTWYIINKI